MDDAELDALFRGPRVLEDYPPGREDEARAAGALPRAETERRRREAQAGRDAHLRARATGVPHRLAALAARERLRTASRVLREGPALGMTVADVGALLGAAAAHGFDPVAILAARRRVRAGGYREGP
jgi:hypothetical protein